RRWKAAVSAAPRQLAPPARGRLRRAGACIGGRRQHPREGAPGRAVVLHRAALSPRVWRDRGHGLRESGDPALSARLHRTPPRAAARRAAKLALAVRDRSPAEGLRRSGRCPRRAARTLVELLLGFGGRLLRGRSGLGLFLRGTLLLLLVELDLQAPGPVHVPIVVVLRPLAAGPQLVRILHRTRVARFETHGFELLH